MIELSKEDKDKLLTQGLSQQELSDILGSSDTDFYLDFFQIQGLKLIKKDTYYYPERIFQTLNEAIFCVVDIETNGSYPSKHQIIEIGAVLIQNGQIIDSFDSLVKADKLPKSIAQLTGINLTSLQEAPNLKEVMEKFKIFSQDHIIVAHPLTFDYNFISSSYEQFHMGAMLNLGVNNIALAERSFSSAKYGLSYLNKTLALEEDFKQHRAYNDALITKDIFLKSLSLLDLNIITVQDLLLFSQKGKKKPRAALVKFEDA